MWLFRKFLFVCLLVGSGCSVATTNMYAPRLDLGGYYFTDKPNWAAVGVVYLPIAQTPNCVFYADGRAILKNDGAARELNLALGYRTLSMDRSRMLGTYLFYDNKRSSSENTFQQATFGLESWFNKIFAGGNFYFPFGKRAQNVSSTVTASGSALTKIGTGLYNILFMQNSNTIQEIALIGGDASLGYQFTRPLSMYAGMYYFHSSTTHVPSAGILGPMLRLRYIADKPILNKKFLSFFDRTTIESQIQYDTQRKWRWYIGIEFGLACGKPSYKLTQMERHMTEQPLRDIDVVSSPQSTNTTTGIIAKDSNGVPIQVFVPEAGQSVMDQIGNPNISVIGVNGVVTDFENTTALADGQTITGGDFYIQNNGLDITVKIAEAGELQSKPGQNLLKLGANNTVNDLILTMVDPPNSANGNRAIFLDSTVNDAGTLTIEGVTSNGELYLSRSGPAQIGTVLIDNSSFITPDTWLPNGLPAVGEFAIANNSEMTVTVKNSTFKTLHTGATQIVGLRFNSASGAVMTIPEVTNNTAVGSDSGMVFQLQTVSGNMTVTGDIADNTVSGGNGSAPNESGLLIFVFQGSPTFQVNGAIKNNTLSGTDESLIFANFAGGTNPVFNILGGILDNTFNSSTSGAVTLSSGVTTTTVNGFSGNRVIGSVGTNITINGASTIINVDTGSTTLSDANNGASLSVTGGAVVNPG